MLKEVNEYKNQSMEIAKHHFVVLNKNNNGNVLSAYPAAQSAEQAYTRNVHRDGKCYPNKYQKNVYIDKRSSIIMVMTERWPAPCT